MFHKKVVYKGSRILKHELHGNLNKLDSVYHFDLENYDDNLHRGRGYFHNWLNTRAYKTNVIQFYDEKTKLDNK